MISGKVNSDHRKFTDFKALVFDVYSTLIDEREGTYRALQPLIQRLPPNLQTPFNSRAHTISSFEIHEHKLQALHPTLPFPEILALAYKSFSTSLSLPTPSEEEITTFSHSSSTFPSFPDSVPALKKLGRYYKLVILSNIDEKGIAETVRNHLNLGGEDGRGTGNEEGKVGKWDKVLTAERIGSYKPDLRNFEYVAAEAERDWGVRKEEIMSTAQSLRADLVPAKKMGMGGCWIDRGDEGESYDELGEQAEIGWRFSTLGEMADAVEKVFEEKRGSEI